MARATSAGRTAAWAVTALLVAASCGLAAGDGALAHAGSSLASAIDAVDVSGIAPGNEAVNVSSLARAKHDTVANTEAAGAAATLGKKKHHRKRPHGGNDDDDDDSPGDSKPGCAACWPDAFGWLSWIAAVALVFAPIGLSAWLGLKLHRRLLLAATR